MATRDDLQRLIHSVLKEQAEEDNGYVDDDDITATCIDGYFNIRTLADHIIALGHIEP